MAISLFNILGKEIESTLDASPSMTTVSRKSACMNSWLVSSTTYFLLHGTPFLVERMTDKLCLFWLGYLADIFYKMSEVSLSLWEKQLTMYVASDKSQAFRWKREFGKLLPVTMSLRVYWYLDFSDENGGGINWWSCFQTKIGTMKTAMWINCHIGKLGFFLQFKSGAYNSNGDQPSQHIEGSHQSQWIPEHMI